MIDDPATLRPWLRYYVRPGTKPTKREVQAFLAVIEYSTVDAAAYALGITHGTLTHLLERLYVRIGAFNRTHAAVLLYRRLGDRYVLPGDRQMAA